jgi:hypothetical protein
MTAAYCACFTWPPTIASQTCLQSRTYHDGKRSQDKTPPLAVLCLARRRLNILWAMQRDNTSYQPGMPRASS